MSRTTHSMGVMCAECKEILLPDNCCERNPHGHTYQEPNGWAAATWTDHACFKPFKGQTP